MNIPRASGATSVALGATIVLALALAPVSAAPREPAVLSRPSVISAQAPYAAMLAVSSAGERLVAVGERGIVLLSDDEGATWRQAKVPVGVSLTAVAFPDAENGYAVGHMGVVLGTRDGGENWSKLLDGVRAAAIAAEATTGMDARSSRRVRALVEEGPDKPFLDLFFWNAREGVVVGAYGYGLRTSDGGRTWESMMAALPNPDGLHLYGVRAGRGANADDLYIVGEQGLMLRSEDRGRSFTALESPYEGSWFGMSVTPDGALVAYGLKGALQRSDDRGDTWAPVTLTDGARVGGGISAAFAGPEGHVLALDQTGLVLESRDDGRDFHPLTNTRSPLTGVAIVGGRTVLSSLRGMIVLSPTSRPQTAENSSPASSKGSTP